MRRSGTFKHANAASAAAFETIMALCSAFPFHAGGIQSYELSDGSYTKTELTHVIYGKFVTMTSSNKMLSGLNSHTSLSLDRKPFFFKRQQQCPYEKISLCRDVL